MQILLDRFEIFAAVVDGEAAHDDDEGDPCCHVGEAEVGHCGLGGLAEAGAGGPEEEADAAFEVVFGDEAELSTVAAHGVVVAES